MAITYFLKIHNDVGTYWNCLMYEVIPICTNNIYLVTENKENCVTCVTIHVVGTHWNCLCVPTTYMTEYMENYFEIYAFKYRAHCLGFF